MAKAPREHDLERVSVLARSIFDRPLSGESRT